MAFIGLKPFILLFRLIVIKLLMEEDGPYFSLIIIVLTKTMILIVAKCLKIHIQEVVMLI